MEHAVIISIEGTQTDPEGSCEKVEFVTCGSLAGDAQGGFRLSYDESELTGLDGTNTTFCIAGDQITMLRTGTLTSEMVFREGERHIALYDTAYGGFMLGVNTQKARSTIDATGGDLELRYAIDVENALVGKNTFRIQVKHPE